MSYMEPIILYDGKKHQPIPSGDKITPSVLPVDTGIDNVMTVGDNGLKVSTANMVSLSEGNGLHVGVDGKLMVTLPEVPEISTDAGNYLRYGNDRGFYVGGGEFLSRDSDNIATIDTSGKVKVAAKDIAEGLISKTSECNLLHLTSDGKLAVSPDVVVSGSSLESAEVVTNPSGQEAGVYLRLVFKKLDDGSIQTSYTRLPDPVAAGEGVSVTHQDGTAVVSAVVAPDGGLSVSCEGIKIAADIVKLEALDAVKEDVEKNTQAIAQNTDAINAVKSDVAKNLESINAIKTDVAKNADKIATNTESIESLKTRTSQLESASATHAEQIEVIAEALDEAGKLYVTATAPEPSSLKPSYGVLHNAYDLLV